MNPEDKDKILSMREHGMSVDSICHRYRHRYKADDVRRFIAVPKKPGDGIEDEALKKAVFERASKRKRKRRTKAEMAAWRASQGESA